MSMYAELAAKTKERKNASALEKKLASCIIELNAVNGNLKTENNELKTALKNIRQSFHDHWQKSKALCDKYFQQETTKRK